MVVELETPTILRGRGTSVSPRREDGPEQGPPPIPGTLPGHLHLLALFRHQIRVLEFATRIVVALITGTTAGKSKPGPERGIWEEQWQATQSSK